MAMATKAQIAADEALRHQARKLLELWTPDLRQAVEEMTGGEKDATAVFNLLAYVVIGIAADVLAALPPEERKPGERLFGDMCREMANVVEAGPLGGWR